MRFTHATLAAAIAFAALAAPARAELLPVGVDEIRSDAYTTQVPALTWTLAEDRRAAVTFLDDATTLLELAEVRLGGDDPATATPDLMAASGKVTSAYLLLFRDRDAAEGLREVATALGGAAPLATMSAGEARALLVRARAQVAAAYRTQLAALGGGAGGGGGGGGTGYMEELEHLDDPSTEPPPVVAPDETFPTVP
jgi:hypothetical protein